MIQAMARTETALSLAVPRRASVAASKPRSRAMVARRAGLILERPQQVAIGHPVDVLAVVRSVLRGGRAGDGRGGHATLRARLAPPGFPAGAPPPRTRASRAWASGIRRISFYSWSR